MDKKQMLNTTKEFVLANGEKVNLTLNFYFVYQLKEKNKSLYERYNKVMMDGPVEVMDFITIMYTAYCCAMIHEAKEEILTETEFMLNCGEDITNVMKTAGELIKPKKR